MLEQLYTARNPIRHAATRTLEALAALDAAVPFLRSRVGAIYERGTIPALAGWRRRTSPAWAG